MKIRHRCAIFGDRRDAIEIENRIVWINFDQSGGCADADSVAAPANLLSGHKRDQSVVAGEAETRDGRGHVTIAGIGRIADKFAGRAWRTVAGELHRLLHCRLGKIVRHQENNRCAGRPAGAQRIGTNHIHRHREVKEVVIRREEVAGDNAIDRGCAYRAGQLRNFGCDVCCDDCVSGSNAALRVGDILIVDTDQFDALDGRTADGLLDFIESPGRTDGVRADLRDIDRPAHRLGVAGQRPANWRC